MIKVAEIEGLLVTSKFFCLAPWVHFHVTSMGMMGLCSMAEQGPYDPGYGNLNKETFAQLWQGKAIREFRLKMLRGEPDPRCINCYGNRLGHWTLRNEINSYTQHLEWVADTNEQGFAPEAKPLFWDIRFSNICNLKCRSCIDVSSASWYDDAEVLGYLDIRNTEKKIQGVADPAGLLHDLETYLPVVEGIRFAGGEPLLMEANYTILEQLTALGKYDTRIEYETNMTNLHYKGHNPLEVWPKFTNLLISISLDGLRTQSEFLRTGLKWDEVLQNWEDIKTHCPGVRTRINYTVSVYNVFHLADFHREMVESGRMRAEQIQLICLVEPYFLSMRLLPREMKKEVTRKLKAHIRWLRKQEPFNHPEGFRRYANCFMQWLACIKHLNEEDWSHLIPMFIFHSSRLDELRNENSLAVFPELQPVLGIGQPVIDEWASSPSQSWILKIKKGEGQELIRKDAY